MSEKENDPLQLYVTLGECRDRHKKVELALFGLNGRGGIVADIAEIKKDIKSFQTVRTFLFSLTSGAVGALIAWTLSHL